MNGLTDLTCDDPRVNIGLATWASSPPVLRPHHAGNRIDIGKFCCLGQNVSIFAGGTHPIRNLTQHHLKLYLGIGDFENWSAQCDDRNDVTTIGNDVWIGDGAIILTGVTVGNGAVMICPPLSGPETMIVWTAKGTLNAEQEAQAGRDHRQAA